MDNETDTFRSRCKGFWSNHWQGIATFLIPLALLPILFIDLQSKIYRIIYLYCVMAFYWFTHVVPIYMTALLPVTFLPVMGVLDANLVSELYFYDTVVLFIGATLMALALEYCNITKRIAYKMILLTGRSLHGMLWSLIFVTVFLSMWISNTAATALMSALVRDLVDDLDAQGVIKAYEEPDKSEKDSEPKASRIASGFFLSVAFAATIGGTGTLLGTGTHMAFKGIYDLRFVRSLDYITFTTFILYTWPMVILLTIFLCLWMQLLFLRNLNTKNAMKKFSEDEKSTVRSNYDALGPISVHEIQVLILLIILVTIFVTKGGPLMNGWADFINEKHIGNSWPVLCVALLLFTIPMRYMFCRYVGRKGPYTDKAEQSLMSWSYTAKNFPWGYMLIIGGGLALSQGIFRSGKGTWLLDIFVRFSHTNRMILQLVCIISVMFLTCFAWNIIIANLTIPIIIELAIACGIHPLYLVFPSGLAASYAFMTPFGTPPNQLVMSFANIRIKHMLLAGIGPTIAALTLLFVNGNTWHSFVFSDNDEFPQWAIGNFSAKVLLSNTDY